MTDLPAMTPSARERVEAYSSLRDAGVFVRDPAIAEVSRAYRDGAAAVLTLLRDEREKYAATIASMQGKLDAERQKYVAVMEALRAVAESYPVVPIHLRDMAKDALAVLDGGQR